MVMADSPNSSYLAETEFLNFSYPALQQVISDLCLDGMSEKEQAVALFYFVRDQILYDPYTVQLSPENYRASFTLQAGRGFCITKSALYAALLRGAEIPARLGYADVKNHLTSKKLSEAMGTDIFYYHGYTEVFLQGRWIKATPVFNASLCEKAGLHPLDFNGEDDSIFHSFSLSGERHMEYVHDRGVRPDLPFDEILNAFIHYYPAMMKGAGQHAVLDGDFQREVSAGM